MRTRVQLHLKPIVVASTLACFVGAVVLQSSLRFPLLEADVLAPESPQPQVRLDPGTRWGHWTIFLDALQRSPWSGYGWNQVSNAQFVAAANHPPIREWAMHSHNLVLDLLIYNGLPLGLLLCGAAVLWFARRIAECQTLESWYLLFGLFALLLHAMLEYPLHYLYFLLPAGLMMGLLQGATSCASASRWSRWSLILPVAGLTALAGSIGQEYVNAEEALRDLELATRGVGPPASELVRADWYFVDGWAAYHRALTITIDANVSDVDYDNLRKVAARYTYPAVLERFAQATALRGRVDDAQQILLHSCKVHTRSVCQGMNNRWDKFLSDRRDLRLPAFPALPS